MLDWSMLYLSKAAGVSVSTVQRMEKGSLPPVSDHAVAAVQHAFEEAGICFLDGEGKEPGLTLRLR